jgi:hypothetical protein
MGGDLSYEWEVAQEHDRIMAEEGYCWHPEGGILDGYSDCEAEVWLRHHPQHLDGPSDGNDGPREGQ